MARARLLKPDFFRDEDLAELPLAARLLFAGLWTLADRDGRLEDRPRKIKADLFPFDAEIDVGALLVVLASERMHSPGAFITRYVVAGRHYLQVNAFTRHQNPHVREPKGVLPGPEQGEAVPSTGPAPGQHGANTEPEQCQPERGTPIPESRKNAPLQAKPGASTVPAPGQHGASTVPERNEHQSGPAESVTVTESESESVHNAPAAPSRVTWLTPYCEAWTAATGGEAPAGVFSGVFKKLEAKHSREKVLAHWRHYLATVPAQFANAPGFSQKFGAYAPGLDPTSRPAGNWDTPDVSERAREYAREPDPDPEEVAASLQRTVERFNAERPEGPALKIAGLPA